MLLWWLFWFVPTSVRSQIGRTIEDFVTLGASVFHVDNHGASAIERKEGDYFVVAKTFTCSVCSSVLGSTLMLLDRILRMTCYSKGFIYIVGRISSLTDISLPTRKHDISPPLLIRLEVSIIKTPHQSLGILKFYIKCRSLPDEASLNFFFMSVFLLKTKQYNHFAKPPEIFFCTFLYITTTSILKLQDKIHT